MTVSHVIPRNITRLGANKSVEQEVLREFLSTIPDLKFQDKLLFSDGSVFGIYLSSLTDDDAEHGPEVKAELYTVEPRLIWNNPYRSGESDGVTRCYMDRHVITPDGCRQYQILIKSITFNELYWVNQRYGRAYLNPKFN